MADEQVAGTESTSSAGERRRSDRRDADRRSDERRLPPPIWRRPAAYVAYGVVGTFLLVMFLRPGGEDADDPMVQAAVVEQTAMAETLPRDASLPVTPTRDATTIAQYETLLAEGDAAVGQILRTELYCGSVMPITVRASTTPNPAIAGLIDGEGRVGGAECRWSSEARSSDFLLVIPPDLAEEFARMPEVELNFVMRRRLSAYVEWLGRSEDLSLRTAGVLREIP